MAKQSSRSSGPGSNSRPGRRSPTIDLSAEEVKRGGAAEPAADEPGAAAAESTSAGSEPSSAGTEERAEPTGGERPERERPERREGEPEPVMPSAFATRASPEAAGAVAGERPARGRGAIAAGLLAAALAGGVIVLVGLVALDRAGILPFAGEAEEVAALRGQVAALEQELAAARQAAELEGEDLQAQIADLNQRVAVLAETAPAEGAASEPAAPDPALGEEVAGLQAALAALRDELGAASAPAALEKVGERLEQLEGLPERVAELSDGVAALQAAPREGVAAAVETEVAGLADRLAELEDRLALIAERLEGAASAAALANVEAELAAAGERTQAQLGDLAQQISHVQAAIAAETFAAALARGRPFAGELQAVRVFGIDDPALSELAPHAEAGLPDRATLLSRFAELRPQLAASDAPPPSDAGPLERLMQSARNVVEVRPAGPQQGDSATAVASRIEAALAAGDLGRALEEWQHLPPDAQEASRQWAEEARAVLAGEALAQRLRSETLARLAAGG